MIDAVLTEAEVREATARILVVEPSDAGVPVAVDLVRSGFDVTVVHDRHAAFDVFREGDVDAVVVDFTLPALGAVDLCRDLREQSDVPIVVVGERSGETDAVLSLEVGADDFVNKPFGQLEFTARLRSMIRRHERLIGAGRTSPVAPLLVDDLRLDRARHEAFMAGAQLPLAPKEFALLALLLERAGTVVTRRQLLEQVWGIDYVGDSKTLDTHIKRIRAKIEADPINPVRLVTVRGVGFRFERGTVPLGG